MLGTLGRLVAGLFVGFLLFIVAAMGLALVKRRDAVPQAPDADEVDLVATFAPLDYRSTSSAFRGGRVETWFGGGVVDLRQATLDPAGATIEVNALFGGGNLVVPEDWNVETKIAGIGGIGDGRPERERPIDAPTLRVEGLALFGGWGITSEPADERGDDVLAPV
jgi:hypothetical protein